MSCLESMEIQELTLIGNPATYRNEYSTTVFAEIPNLRRLDGIDLISDLKKGKRSSCLKFQDKSRPKNTDDNDDVTYRCIPDGGIRVMDKCLPLDHEE